MKKWILLIIALCSCVGSWAQTKSEKEFSFYYITHDIKTNVPKLTKTLQSAFNETLEYQNQAVFYLANGEEPVIVRVGTPNDNQKDFPALIGQLQEKMSHDISADYDINRIVALFDTVQIISQEGKQLFNMVNWNYYISSEFWSMSYNESVISTLYWTMNMDQLKMEDEFYVNIYRSTEDEFALDKKMPFGPKNMSGINLGQTVITY